MPQKKKWSNIRYYPTIFTKDFFCQINLVSTLIWYKGIGIARFYDLQGVQVPNSMLSSKNLPVWNSQHHIVEDFIHACLKSKKRSLSLNPNEPQMVMQKHEARVPPRTHHHIWFGTWSCIAATCCNVTRNMAMKSDLAMGHLHLLKKIQLQFCMITFKMWNAILLVLVVSLRLNRNESATFRCFGLPSGVTIPQTMRSIRPSWKVPPVPPHGTAWCWWKKSDPVSVGSLSQYLRWGLYKSLKWCKIARYVLSTVFVDFGNVEVGSTRFGWSCSNSQANLS